MTRVASGYSALAPVYDALGAMMFGGALARSRRKFIERVRRVHRTLLVGDGTGGFLLDLLDAGYAGDVVYLDIAPGMLKAARRRVRRAYPATGGRIDFVCGDAAEYFDTNGFDLICSHFFLDGFEGLQLERVVAALSRSLREGGTWLVSDFSQPSGTPLRRAGQRGLHAGLYAFFRAICGIEPRRLPEIDAALEKQGLLPIACEAELGGWLESKVWVRPNEPIL